MNKAYYEISENFTPILQTAKALMQERGENEVLAIINASNINVVNTDYDNWNGGTYGYTVYLDTPVKIYAHLSEERRKNIESVISGTLNDVEKDECHYFMTVIQPKYVGKDVSWQVIGGEEGKRQLRTDIERMVNIMIAVATGGPRIQTEDEGYKQLFQTVTKRLQKINLSNPNPYKDLWEWYGKWSADFRSYQERRDYIRTLFAPLLTYFEQDSLNQDFEIPVVDISPWERVQRTLQKIKINAANANDEEDFQSVGLLCRETIISLAQMVFNPDIHGSTDEEGKRISKTDAMRMIGNYLNSTLSGEHNEELRAYAKATNKLANLLTHKRTALKKDMLLAMTATTALVNFIGIIESKL